jgi:hypothetical protein
MGRFDRDVTNSEQENAPSASATEKLRVSVEGQVRAVVDEAMARAVAIEDRALAKASQMEQETQQKANDVLKETELRANEVLKESQGRAGEVLSGAIQRTDGILQATDTLEIELGKVIASFKEEIEFLRSELQTAKADLSAPPRSATPEPEPAIQAEPPAPKPAPAEPLAAAAPQPDSEATSPAEGEQAGAPVPTGQETPPGRPSSPATPNPEAHAGDERSREMIRQQLIRLSEAGKPREDAERYLGRFKQSGDYKGMLDEIYASEEPSTPKRRGLLRRK